MSELKVKFDELLTAQRELRNQFRETAQTLFKETTKEFFERNPGVNAIVWTQYTPYFNDGDTCEFEVHEPSFTNAEGEDMDDVSAWGEYEGENESVWVVSSYIARGSSDYCKEEKEKVTNASEVDFDSWEQFDKMIQTEEMEDVMEAMFGDHVKVVATREGFDVRDHDHD